MSKRTVTYFATVSFTVEADCLDKADIDAESFKAMNDRHLNRYFDTWLYPKDRGYVDHSVESVVKTHD